MLYLLLDIRNNDLGRAGCERVEQVQRLKFEISSEPMLFRTNGMRNPPLTLSQLCNR
jgi:hypothetical protein